MDLCLTVTEVDHMNLQTTEMFMHFLAWKLAEVLFLETILRTYELNDICIFLPGEIILNSRLFVFKSLVNFLSYQELF